MLKRLKKTGNNVATKKQKVISMLVNVGSFQQKLDRVVSLATSKTGSYVCVSNVHMCMEVFDSSMFADVVNSADLVVADGRPIFWAKQLLGRKDTEQVRGQDLMNALCAMPSSDIKIGLYGGFNQSVLDKVKARIIEDNPSAEVVYAYSPPFRPLTAEEDAEVCQQINDSGVNVLFVGIGCPKQEFWMADHKEKLSCVMLGVGAAFDFIAGSKKHAPKWMQRVGLEWLFRLLSEPKRLWKRYLKQNPRFIYHFSKQLIKHKLGKSNV
ncbi:WecB/TagA/CpsF family glycosyltransferase [Salinibius halmophilus]|uniref:WecB/TagA/CpsF family glycosyltransferase n=1 Tax=Salinibius halmophilus TaxID=1853216 RepID=UPI000E665758|nr:WecB/TagA/CpsF family glycosyltransferase [Salinibius halmophilus]